MRKLLILPAAAAIALLGACEMRVGNDAAPVAENATASGRAEEGRLTVEAPGFNLSVNIPEGLGARARVDADSGLVYPGARFGGIHVQGGREEGRHGRDGEVEIRLTSDDAGDQVVAWYRDPARARDFTISTTTQEGNATVIGGTGRRDNERFQVRIAPREGGGTELRLLVADRN